MCSLKNQKTPEMLQNIGGHWEVIGKSVGGHWEVIGRSLSKHEIPPFPSLAISNCDLGLPSFPKNQVNNFPLLP